MKKKVLIAHPEILYKQLLASALSTFADIEVVGESRHLDELVSGIRSYRPDVAIVEESIFSDEKQIGRLLSGHPELHIILLTREAEKTISTRFDRLSYFYSGGYLIDLYRAIDLIVKGKVIAQPALVKSILGKLRSLEDEGKQLDAMLITFNREKLKVLIDIIFGKSYEEIQLRHGYSEAELESLLKEIVQDLENLTRIQS